MATRSSTLAWRIPWRGEPGRLQSMGLQRVGHNWVTKNTWTINFLILFLLLFSSFFFFTPTLFYGLFSQLSPLNPSICFSFFFFNFWFLAVLIFMSSFRSSSVGLSRLLFSWILAPFLNSLMMLLMCLKGAVLLCIAPPPRFLFSPSFPWPFMLMNEWWLLALSFWEWGS